MAMIVSGFLMYRHDVVEKKYEYAVWLIVLAIDSALLIFMIPYTIWHWCVVLNGKTQVEIEKGLYTDNSDNKKDELDDLSEQHLDQISEFL